MRKLLLVLTMLMLSFTTFGKTVVLEKHNMISLKSAVTYATTSQVKQDLLNVVNTPLIPYMVTERKDPIYFVLDTPGGSIWAGLEMIDFMLSQNREVKTVTLLSASMGFQTVQALGERLITPSGTLMAHKASGGFMGEFGDKVSQLDSRYNYWLRRIERMDRQATARTNGKLTFEQYRDLFENEYWCEGQDCVDKGFADEVVNLTCGKTLAGFTQEKENIEFFGLTIELSYKTPHCPLMSEYDIKIKIKTDGKKETEWTLDNVDKDIRAKILEKMNPSYMMRRSNGMQY